MIAIASNDPSRVFTCDINVYAHVLPQPMLFNSYLCYIYAYIYIYIGGWAGMIQPGNRFVSFVARVAN